MAVFDDLKASLILNNLKVKIFADGACNVAHRIYSHPYVRGFTTNPTLMKNADVTDYERASNNIIKATEGKPISIEVIADNFDDMFRQAKLITSWGDNVYAKIPITNSKGDSSLGVIGKLVEERVQINVTVVMTLWDVWRVAQLMRHGPSCYISIFAGRIADAGVNPVAFVQAALAMVAPFPNIEIIWASTREVYNIFEADRIGCHIITVSPDLIAKLGLVGKNLSEYSLETVQQFRDDAVKAGFTL